MTPREELFRLLNRQAEDQPGDEYRARLNELLRSDKSLVDDYVEYHAIHAQLFWDAGLSATKPVSESSRPAVKPTSRLRSIQTTAALTAILCIAALVYFGSGNNDASEVVDDNPTFEKPGTSEVIIVAEDDNGTAVDEVPVLRMNNHGSEERSSTEGQIAAKEQPSADLLPDEFTDQMIVDRLDHLLAVAWEENNVRPSAEATDFEWLRRVYLTFTGRIPTLEESRSFLSDNSIRKYGKLISEMSNDNERASYLAVVWTNLLVGRTEKRGVNRRKLYEYLVGMFEDNRPWMRTVDELITASGRNDTNGATNFLLAHLNNEATPATAVTARLFLGEQISCVQCHDHPFAKELKQQDYWALNAFFKDTSQKSVRIASTSAGGGDKLAWTLVDQRREKDRMTYFSTRSGLKKATLPSYDGTIIRADSRQNRRRELARLLATDSSHRVGRSMVNRMWAHFFGYGFTRQIDDMGPHADISHPELMDVLTEAFVKSNYDVRRLMVWIGSTKAWRLSSDLTQGNQIDQPDRGESPMFSRVYVRRMSPEQVYESIRVAIRSAAGQPIPDASEYSQHRRDWISQFTKSYDTDENDESMEFDGTITQAMVMMNGGEVTSAIRQASQSLLSGQPARSPISSTLDRIALAMLTRESTPEESKAFRARFRQLAKQSPGRALPVATEDMMWAYLNSSEFQLVH